MPFTLAHPSIVFPFRKYLSLTGLVIGSMSPDFEYFLRMRIASTFSHSFLGVFIFCLPISTVLAFLFHGLIKIPLCANLPHILKQKCALYASLHWLEYFKKNWYIVVVSILIGAMSHLLWDSFTHSDGFFVTILGYSDIDFTILGFDIPLYKCIQHISTFIGILYMLLLFMRMPKQHLNSRVTIIYYWSVVFFLTFLFICFRFSGQLDLFTLGNLIVTFIPCFFLSLCIVGAYVVVR